MRNQTQTAKFASHFEGDELHPPSLFLPKGFEGDEGHPLFQVFDTAMITRLRNLARAAEIARRQIEEEE